jgi:hypothetical protein
MDEIGNSASEEMPELTETFENKNNNKIPEEKMAALYATVIKKNIYEEYDEEYGVKPIFILESDIFGSYKPKPQEFITHNEIYKAIDEQVSASHLKGIQRVRGLWRIYPDNEDDKNALVTNGLTIRNMLIQFYTRNPKVAAREKPDHYRIRVKDVPCSADDGQIYRYLEKQLMCVIHNHYRERLRVDGFLTNCHTGDRIFICDNPGKSLPRSVRIGKYFATIIHRGQIDPRKQTLKCNKCLQQGHKQYECPNQWTCRQCNKPGHRESECHEDLNETSQQEEKEENQSVIDDQSNDVGGETEYETESDTDCDERNEEKSQSTVKPQEKNKNSDKIETLQNKTKDITEEEAKGKTDSQDMPNLPKCQNKTKRRKKKQNESAKGPLDVYLINESQQTPNKSNKQPATTPTDELHLRTTKTKKHRTEVKK